jgi:NADPH:quinone reductase-like Zn-dependent oxidoreductase
MKAILFTNYGSPDALSLKDVERPAPMDDEVLVRVHAVALNEWDYGALLGDSVVNRLIFGMWSPKKRILGSDIAGRVESVGSKVTRFQPGDAVFGDLSGRWGGLAEHVCAPQQALSHMAPEMTFEQAAAIPQAALLALQGLRLLGLRLLGPIRPGQRLLINGAGGGVGTFAIQMAKAEGAEITAVDGPDKLEFLRALGAAQVIDYTREDFTRNGQRYDRILDVKTTRSLFACARALAPQGGFVTVGGDMWRLVQALLLGPLFALASSKRIRILALKPNLGLDEMKELFEAGKVVPVIDRTYPLDEAADAFRHYGTARHKGKVVITVAAPEGRTETGGPGTERAGPTPCPASAAPLCLLSALHGLLLGGSALALGISQNSSALAGFGAACILHIPLALSLHGRIRAGLGNRGLERELRTLRFVGHGVRLLALGLVSVAAIALLGRHLPDPTLLAPGLAALAVGLQTLSWRSKQALTDIHPSFALDAARSRTLLELATILLAGSVAGFWFPQADVLAGLALAARLYVAGRGMAALSAFKAACGGCGTGCGC